MLLADPPQAIGGRTCGPYAAACAMRWAGLQIGTTELVRADGRHTIEWMAAELVARGVDARRVIVPRGEVLAHMPSIVVTHPPGGELHGLFVEARVGPVVWTLDGGRRARLVDDLMRELVESVHVVSVSEADLGNLITLLVADGRACVRGVEVIRIYGAFGREESHR